MTRKLREILLAIRHESGKISNSSEDALLLEPCKALAEALDKLLLCEKWGETEQLEISRFFRTLLVSVNPNMENFLNHASDEALRVRISILQEMLYEFGDGVVDENLRGRTIVISRHLACTFDEMFGPKDEPPEPLFYTYLGRPRLEIVIN